MQDGKVSQTYFHGLGNPSYAALYPVDTHRFVGVHTASLHAYGRVGMKEVPGHSTWIGASARDGNRLVTVSGHDGEIIVWDLQTLEPLHTLAHHARSSFGIAMHPDGRRLLVGHACELWLYDLEDGVQHRVLSGEGMWVKSALTLPDGERVVAAMATGGVALADLSPMDG
jgi:WD40 repeat protein